MCVVTSGACGPAQLASKTVPQAKTMQFLIIFPMSIRPCTSKTAACQQGRAKRIPVFCRTLAGARAKEQSGTGVPHSKTSRNFEWSRAHSRQRRGVRHSCAAFITRYRKLPLAFVGLGKLTGGRFLEGRALRAHI